MFWWKVREAAKLHAVTRELRSDTFECIINKRHTTFKTFGATLFRENATFLSSRKNNSITHQSNNWFAKDGPE